MTDTLMMDTLMTDTVFVGGGEGGTGVTPWVGGGGGAQRCPVDGGEGVGGTGCPHGCGLQSSMVTVTPHSTTHLKDPNPNPTPIQIPTTALAPKLWAEDNPTPHVPLLDPNPNSIPQPNANHHLGSEAMG